MASITINKATGAVSGNAIAITFQYIDTTLTTQRRTIYAYKIAGTKGDYTLASPSQVTNWGGTTASLATTIANTWRTGLSPAYTARLTNHYVATLKFSIDGTTYAAERILNQERYQAATTTAAGFPAGAGKGAVNVGRFFGDPKNPRNYGIFTPDGRRIGN